MLKRALNARVAEVLPDPTPLDRAPRLGARLGRPVLLKREDLTPVFSFKIRGAYNRMARFSPDERRAGAIAASAGNHAQGVAFAAQRLGMECRIVMPRTTPAIKVRAVESLGARIELVGDDYADAAARATEIARESGMVLVPPYDDLDVIAGQATIALEILHQAPRDLAAIFVPVGGGGLAAGVSSVVKELRPEVRVFGVEPEDADAMARSLAEGRIVALDRVGIFADGVAVKQPGEHTFELCRRYLDGVVVVSLDETCAAIKDVFEDTRSVLEPAGALAVAGLKHAARSGGLPDGPVVAVASGANMNFARLGYVTERAEVGEHHEAILAVTIPERPGSFLEFCSAVGERSITEFNYRLSSRREAHVFVGLEVTGAEEAAAIARGLGRAGYPCTDLSDNDLAKSHVRHMVGGRADVCDETLFTFEFPERPGALLQFLAGLGARWNISLFHYRNHGAAFGRVLCGLEVPPAERAELRARLDGLGFRYTEETENPAGRLFLS
ncbi:MAG TPA: threonine ammonia-lyase, biosynthetic [Candidatus Binatia bacterium]|nr:threonine ammonia-lyase, biosynthetic [Candidatus Binatia bacterium]